MRDDGPSEADLERLSGELACCPACGAEVWDDVEICPECGQHVAGSLTTRRPLGRQWRSKWLLLIVAALIVAILILTL